MNAAERRVTYAEMLDWPDDGRQYELYDGEAIVVPAPFPGHQRVALNIAAVLRDYVARVGGVTLLAPLDIVLSEHDVVQPDVVFFSQDRRRLVRDWEVTRSAPDLAVEVLSDSTASRDRGRKMQLLARFGVPEYWIVDPIAETIEVFALAGDAYQLRARAGRDASVTSPTLDGLTIDASRVFAD